MEKRRVSNLDNKGPVHREEKHHLGDKTSTEAYLWWTYLYIFIWWFHFSLWIKHLNPCPSNNNHIYVNTHSTQCKDSCDLRHAISKFLLHAVRILSHSMMSQHYTLGAGNKHKTVCNFPHQFWTENGLKVLSACDGVWKDCDGKASQFKNK